MASLTIKIEFGSEEQNRIIANLLLIAFENDNVLQLLRSLPYYEEFREKIALPDLQGIVDASDYDDPNHKVELVKQ